MTKAKKYYTVPEFADKSGVSTQTIYQQLKRGRLKNYGRKVNGVQKISAEALVFYTSEDDPEPEQQDQAQSEESPETVALLREQIRILSETLDHERQTLEHEREMHKQTQEALRQTQELMKAQMVQFALTTKQRAEEAGSDADPVPSGSDQVAPETPEKSQTRSQSSSQQQKAERPAEQAPERRGFWSRFFGRS